MFLVIYIINTLIRLVCGWLMFYSFVSGYYLLASFFLLGVLKHNWLVYRGYGNRGNVHIGIDFSDKLKKR